MPIDPQQTLYYKRARFTTRLPLDRVYDRSHFWLLEIEPNLYRVGFTKFATRMLGDLVELNLDCQPDEAVSVSQEIGTIEGFKAISSIYCVVDGTFLEINPELEGDPTLLDRDPYDCGWMYLVRGLPTAGVCDVHGYSAFLDVTIDKILADSMEDKEKGKAC